MSDHVPFEAAWDEELDGRRGPTNRESPRPRRRHRTLTVVALVAVTSLASMTAAWAIDPPFTDVPADNAFVEEIAWLKNTGITEGYPDGSFRPTQNISRQGLSAWMQRMFNVRNDRGMASSTDGFDTAVVGFVPLPGAVTTVTVPPGTIASLVVNFSAETYCAGASGFCQAKIMADKPSDIAPGFELGPAAGADFALDSSDGNSETPASWEGHSFQRSTYVIYPGTWEITVQVSVSKINLEFGVDDWSLVAETDLYRTDVVLS